MGQSGIMLAGTILVCMSELQSVFAQPATLTAARRTGHPEKEGCAPSLFIPYLCMRTTKCMIFPTAVRKLNSLFILLQLYADSRAGPRGRNPYNAIGGMIGAAVGKCSLHACFTQP